MAAMLKKRCLHHCKPGSNTLFYQGCASDPIRSVPIRSDPFRSGLADLAFRYDPPGAPPQLRRRAGEGVAVEMEEGVAVAVLV